MATRLGIIAKCLAVAERTYLRGGSNPEMTLQELFAGLDSNCSIRVIYGMLGIISCGTAFE